MLYNAFDINRRHENDTGRHYKKYRDDADLSMDGFAQLSGLSKSYISVLERNITPHGNEPSPGIDTYKAVAKVLGIDVNDLIRAVDDDIELPPPLPSNFIPARFHQAPLIGEIACGTPILAEQNIIDYIDVPEHIQCDFALKCRGNSMIDLGVKDGDVVYIRSQPEVQNGQVAAVIVDGAESEATLKKFSGMTITSCSSRQTAKKPRSHSTARKCPAYTCRGWL